MNFTVITTLLAAAVENTVQGKLTGFYGSSSLKIQNKSHLGMKIMKSALSLSTVSCLRRGRCSPTLAGRSMPPSLFKGPLQSSQATWEGTSPAAALAPGPRWPGARADPARRAVRGRRVAGASGAAATARAHSPGDPGSPPP